jgi:hypothetical protein
MTSHIHCDYQALGILRFRHLGGLFMQPGDSEEISVSRIHTLCKVGGAPTCMSRRDAQKICYGHSSVPFLYSIPLYSTVGSLFQEWGS